MSLLSRKRPCLRCVSLFCRCTAGLMLCGIVLLLVFSVEVLRASLVRCVTLLRSPLHPCGGDRPQPCLCFLVSSAVLQGKYRDALPMLEHALDILENVRGTQAVSEIDASMSPLFRSSSPFFFMDSSPVVLSLFIRLSFPRLFRLLLRGRRTPRSTNSTTACDRYAC